MQLNRLKAVSITAALSLSLTGCLSTGGGTATQQTSILVSEIVAVCGAIVGTQAEQRINQEWAKYPDAEANRPIIEAVAETLLTDPATPEQQRTSDYRKYMTCATGLLVTNGILR